MTASVRAFTPGVADQEIRVGVSKRVVPPNFARATFNSDVALLRLSEPIFTVEPVSLLLDERLMEGKNSPSLGSAA